LKVRELISLLEDDGWLMVRMRGSHRQFQHPSKAGTVTVAGKMSADIPPGTLRSALKQAGLKKAKENQTMQYLVVVEEGEEGFGAYVPDLPGCIAAAETKEEVLELIREAMDFHIEGLKEQRQEVPLPTSTAEVVEIGAD
jgi:predicted RNA binding protein YcfA (HicA-like mRNA interferase family)/predicted RNase H-like HicB family nuclease